MDRLLDAGAEDGADRCSISAINLGEVYYRMGRTRGSDAAEALWNDVRHGRLPLQVVDATRNRVRLASGLKMRHRIAFADAFAMQLAAEQDRPLATGDPEIQAAAPAESLQLLWLPTAAEG